MAANTHTGLEVTGLIQAREQLEKLLLQDPTLNRELQKLVDKALVQVRRKLVGDARDLMSSDNRNAYRAVRRSVYRQILGGQVNILRKRRAGKLGELPDANSRQHWRRRGYKTGQMARYQGSDRGFILRFMNKGTEQRVSPTMDNHQMYRRSTAERPKNRTYKSNILGYRGRMGNQSARNFFDKSEQYLLQQVPNLNMWISDLIAEELNRI